MLYLVAHHRYVPQQHECCEEESGNERPPEQGLYALCHKSFHYAIHHLREVYAVAGCRLCRFFLKQVAAMQYFLLIVRLLLLDWRLVVAKQKRGMTHEIC